MTSSNSFLPFITNKSSIKSIFKKIIIRSKGSKKHAIANILCVVLKLGIDETRERLSRFPNNLTSAARIKQLIADCSDILIPVSTFYFWESVMNIIGVDEYIPEGFTKQEYIILIAVVASIDIKKLEELGINSEEEFLEKCKEYQNEDFNISLNKIPNVKIAAKDSKRVGFTSLEEFKAYLAVKPIQSKDVHRIFPIFLKSDTEEGLESECIAKNCVMASSKVL